MWHESLWTSVQAAEKAGDDEEIVLPSVDIGIELGVSSNRSYFISRMNAQGELLAAEMAVDADKDGEIIVGSPKDKTTQGQPYAFWVNNDDDRNNEDHPGSDHKDSDNNVIKSVRDLEGFTRLWLHVGAFREKIASGAVKLGLKWKDVEANSLVINIYEAVEGDGGTRYLTDPRDRPPRSMAVS